LEASFLYESANVQHRTLSLSRVRDTPRGAEMARLQFTERTRSLARTLHVREAWPRHCIATAKLSVLQRVNLPDGKEQLLSERKQASVALAALMNP